MVGISYSGISQFEVAGTDPPDLAAITPLSSTDDLFSTGYPGGIYNDGFAASWIAQRKVDAEAGAEGRPAVGDGRDRHRGQDLPRQPGAAPPGPATRVVGRTRAEPRPVPVQPTVAGGVGDPRQGPGVPRRRPRGRADGPAVAGVDHGAEPRQERLRHHAQRHPHRLARSRHPVALARVPRHLRGGPGPRPEPVPHGAGPRRLRQGHRRGEVPRPSPGALHDGHLGDPGQVRLRRPRPPSQGALRQRRREPRARGHAAHLRSRLLPMAAERDRDPLLPRPRRDARHGQGLGHHLGVVPARPVRPSRHRPGRLGQRLGGPAAL